MIASTQKDFFARHEFLIRRLHSLSGLIPVGAYMIVHLLVNASLLNGPGTFQSNVYQIHSLGRLLPIVEWLFIFLPILFHGVVGVWIVYTGKSNTDVYRYSANWRYRLQRISGMIAFAFIFFHVLHLHGWFHSDWWKSGVLEPMGLGQFRPYNAASSLSEAMSGVVWPIFYFIGIVACVYHLANGVWTMGITWGVWVSPKAQATASRICAAAGILLLLIGLSALGGAITTKVDEAIKVEDAMYESRSLAGEIEPAPHKRSQPKGE